MSTQHYTLKYMAISIFIPCLVYTLTLPKREAIGDGFSGLSESLFMFMTFLFLRTGFIFYLFAQQEIFKGTVLILTNICFFIWTTFMINRKHVSDGRSHIKRRRRIEILLFIVFEILNLYIVSRNAE